MTRGQTVPVGTERKAKNGYWYIKCRRSDSTTHWRPKAHVLIEKYLGRDLKDEQVRFRNGDIEDFSEENLEAIPLGKASIRRRLAQLESRLADVQSMIDYYKKQLEGKP